MPVSYAPLFGVPLIVLPLLMFLYAILVRVVKVRNYSRSLSFLAILTQILLFACALGTSAFVARHGNYDFLLFSWMQDAKPVYHLQIHLELSTCVFLLLASFLSGVIGRFSISYLAYEEGYYKFFINFYLMQLALYTLILSANFYFVLIAWELLGLASIFLISFYQGSQKTVDNALFVLGIYKFCDLFLILALLLFQHEQHGFILSKTSHQASVFFLCVLCLASMGKSALFPFSKWVPRAMEGPTTSSAIFYGALSIHAGVILLVKFRVFFEAHVWIHFLLFWMGLLSAVYASLKSRIQTDVKSTLAYATVVQVGLIYMEFALGWYELVLLHTVSNALLKTYQFIRTPSNIHHFHHLEKMNYHLFDPHGLHFEMFLPRSTRIWSYKLVYHNFGLTLAWQTLLKPLKQFQTFLNHKLEALTERLVQVPIFRSQALVLLIGGSGVLGLIWLERHAFIQQLYLSGGLLLGALFFSFLSLKHTTIEHYLIKIKSSYFCVSASAILFFGNLEHYNALYYFGLNLISLFILDFFIKYLSRRLDLDSLQAYLGIGNRYKYISMIAISILLMLTFTPGFASFIVFDAVLEEISEKSKFIMIFFLAVNILNMYSFFKFMFKLLFGETQQHLSEYPDFTPFERLKLALLILPMIAAGLLPFL
ncbi:hypothetical protein COW36_17730 [bacterium (Candidatus Blackallbacteria) CG17_big_fil_post_rev_8_21_14_2_50_48_46]|uniref:NADH:quinone oxidoreductase/Mrp antiporter transmembrane domain-containing protein n=1 Tax=bacterium (Candidatus Blackallbacteria) CG17_big_fil_post_rev_8_21_14_2_50_48_46 TaxID=2014261 RepID=A0A2M7G0L3_9BACT|nr:MAG: hypothetical protein COW64_00995 [bacterium (Candidatus Blackallbacteria) CG18_big_fil_WC_8_21_14_2_50_49_26]PIW15258.1 MAG: hypothetical protein COW36_17730 [bacterium (Candidatus Blackallbacteria) CG17_big_fil_post_rev_8_21_14_2_50_48_46]PIW45233.1 MAG: hypothetical protein COW20_21285 [bacterium (Candidatus Blackallbacteria) CG13_big_fil_rev_8_21_14_2_50_49_14]